MRYHGVVLAANNGIPFVSLSYENKMTEVTKYTGFEQLEVKLWEWSKANFAEALHTAVSNAQEIRAKLLERKTVLERLAQVPCDYMWLLSNYER